MANASCPTVTVVNTVMVVAGTVTGSIVVGMTVTGAGVPAGVTVTVAAPGGGAGSYTVTASAANVSVAEPMVFSLAGIASFITNSSNPQIADYSAAAIIGFGLVFGAVGQSTNTAMGAEYQFGTHQQAIYENQFKGVIFHPPHPNVVGDAVETIRAAPQAYDFTLQASLSQPMVNQSLGISAEYQFGTHQVQIANSQIQGSIWPALVTPVNPGVQVPLRSIHVQGQELYKDLTIQGWVSIPSVTNGWISTNISAGPQLADLTIQPLFKQTLIKLITAPYTPTTLIAAAQADPWQRQAQVFRPQSVTVAPQPQVTIIAAPVDATAAASQQTPSNIWQAVPTPTKPSLLVQPVIIQVAQQQYQDIPYAPFAQPVIGVIIPPLPYVVPPYSIYWDYTPWKADTNRYTVDSANTVWSADGGQTQGTGGTQPPNSTPPGSAGSPQNPLSVTVTLNTRI